MPQGKPQEGEGKMVTLTTAQCLETPSAGYERCLVTARMRPFSLSLTKTLGCFEVVNYKC